MHIALMADIIQDTVMKRIINIEKCNAQFNHAQIGCQMPAGLGYDGNQMLSDFLTELVQLIAVQRFDVCSAADSYQDSQWFSSFYGGASPFPIESRMVHLS